MAAEKDNSKSTVVRRVKASGTNSSPKKSAAPSAKNSAAKKTPAQKTVSKAAPAKSAAKKSAAKASRSSSTTRPKKKTFFLLKPIFATGRYIRNSWYELRQVRWTNRRATWGLTLAVILFSVFFATFILLFDWIFNWLIKEVIL